LLTAGAIEKLDRKKPVVVNAGFFLERLPVVLWPIAALMAAQRPISALVVFLIGYAWHGLGAGMIGPAWQDLFARCFSLHKRGWMFGITTFLGTGVGTLGAVVSSWILRTFEYPVNFFYIFSVAAVAISLSWISLIFLREPVQAVDQRTVDRQNMWPRMKSILKQDENFRRYLIARMLMVMGTMGTGFITVVAVQHWEVPDSTVGIYTAILLLGQTIGNLFAGVLADRKGHKLPLVLGAAAQIVGFLVAWLTPVASGLFIVFALIGFAVGTSIVSGLLIALEFSAPQRRPTYIGIANTSVGIASVVAPLAGGWIADFGYSWLFGFSAFFGIAGLLFLYMWVQDPRSYPAGSIAVAEPT
jgi:MFS family permease